MVLLSSVWRADHAGVEPDAQYVYAPMINVYHTILVHPVFMLLLFGSLALYDPNLSVWYVLITLADGRKVRIEALSTR